VYCANQRDSGAPLRISGTTVEIDPSWRAEGSRQVLGRPGLAAHYTLAPASSARADKLRGHAACVEPGPLHQPGDSQYARRRHQRRSMVFTDLDWRVVPRWCGVPSEIGPERCDLGRRISKSPRLCRMATSVPQTLPLPSVVRTTANPRGCLGSRPSLCVGVIVSLYVVLGLTVLDVLA
jgi:hypothetical protein